MNSDRFNIANVIHHMHGGGVVIQALNMALFLSRYGHDVRFVTTPKTADDPTPVGMLDGISIDRTSQTRSFLAPFALARKLDAVNRADKISLIQAFDALVAGMATLIYSQYNSNVPWVVRLGTDYRAHFKYQFNLNYNTGVIPHFKSAAYKTALLWFLSQMEHAVLCQASAVVANCRYLLDVYRSRYPHLEKSVVIQNGVDTDKFTPNGSRYDLDPDLIWILYIGRIEERKGLTNLIRSFPDIVKRHPTARLRIVGRALDNNYSDLLKRLARDLSVASKVVFSDAVPNDNVPSLMRAADILVVPSTTGGAEVEGLPNIILEGMASGIPIVATNICGIPEVVEQGKTGFLVSPGLVDELTSGVSELIESESLRSEFGIRARNYILANNTMDGMVRKYLKLYTHLIESQMT